MPEYSGDYFLIQWHVTARCEQKCMHCYVYDEVAYQQEIANELSYHDCLTILDDIAETIQSKFKRKLQVNFSGGDPLLRSDFLDLLLETRNRGAKVGILGNPHKVTKDVAKHLHHLGLRSYQVSIDGLESTHDFIRGKDSFKTTLKGIRILKEEGVRVAVMFTLSETNKNDLLAVTKLCSDEGVDIFAFDSMVLVGNALTSRSLVLSQQELRKKMFDYLEFTHKLNANGSETSFRRKSNLWTLLESELGIESRLIHVSRKSNKIYAGCTIGISAVSVLADGTVYPCRRLPMKIGKFPEQTLEEVFFSKKMEDLRQENNIEKCESCQFLTVCRGCRAMAYATHNNYFAPDPLCWRQ